jgi:hypothetical protein
MTDARIERRPTDVILLFSFDDAGEGETDPYVRKVMMVAMEMFREELMAAPDIGWVDYVSEPQVPPETRLEMARKSKATYIVSGRFELLRGNVLIFAQWLDVESQTGGERGIGLGSQQLGDFELVAGQMRELARWIHEDRKRDVALEAEAVRVSCFSGAERSEFGFLGRYITLELPQFLGPALQEQGVSSLNFPVLGLSFDEYEERCLTGKSPERKVGGVRYEARYEISGTIIPLTGAVAVEALIFDRFGSRALSIGGLELAGGEFRDFPRRLGEALAPTVTIILAQERLSARGFGHVDITGKFSEETKRAIQKLQLQVGLPVTGRIDKTVLEVLGLYGPIR